MEVKVRNVGQGPVRIWGEYLRVGALPADVRYWRLIRDGRSGPIYVGTALTPWPKYVRIFVRQDEGPVRVYETVIVDLQRGPKGRGRTCAVFDAFGRPDCPVFPDLVEINADEAPEWHDVMITNTFHKRVQVFRGSFWIGYLDPGETFTFKLAVPLEGGESKVRFRAVEGDLFRGREAVPSGGFLAYEVLFDKTFTLDDLSKTGWNITLREDDKE